MGLTTGQVSNQQNTNMPTFGATHHHVAPLTSSISNQKTHRYANDAAQALRASGWTPPVPAPVQTTLSSMPVIPSEEQRGTSLKHHSTIITINDLIFSEII